MGCTRSPFSGGLQCCAFLYGPGEPGRYPAQLNERLRLRLPIATLSFVAFGLWVVQTDCFPIAQGVRPSWYLYGWPICFATSSRNRFGFTTFQFLPLLIDLMATSFMLACTYCTARHLQRQNKFVLSDVFSGIAGIAFMLMVVTGPFFSLLEMASFSPPVHGYSELDGNSRPLYRISTIAVPSLCLAVFSIGFAVSSTMLSLLNNPSFNSNGDSGAG